MALVRRLEFLPGVLNGFGVDANATYTQSVAHVHSRVGVPFPRQANWNGNAALTYAKGIVRARVTSQCNGPYIFSLRDGSNSVASGDACMMAHKQVDASLNMQVQRNAQVVPQVLNINSAVRVLLRARSGRLQATRVLPLFERAGRASRLTAAGEALAAHARELFSVEASAEEELRALRGLEHGSLRIGASTRSRRTCSRPSWRVSVRRIRAWWSAW